MRKPKLTITVGMTMPNGMTIVRNHDGDLWAVTCFTGHETVVAEHTLRYNSDAKCQKCRQEAVHSRVIGRQMGTFIIGQRLDKEKGSRPRYETICTLCKFKG